MPRRRRLGKRLFKSLLPIALVIVLAVVGALSFVVYCITRPTKRPYVVTPESFSRISGRAIKVTDETWPMTMVVMRAVGCLEGPKARRQSCCFIVSAAT